MQDKILASIKSGEVKMRPRLYFALRAMLLGLGVAAVVLVALYFGSFIFYALAIRFAWEALLIALLCVFIFETFLNRFAIGYRRPILTTFLGVVVVAFLLSLVIHSLGAHERLHRYVRERRIPIFMPYYDRFGPPLRQLPIRGIVKPM